VIGTKIAKHFTKWEKIPYGKTNPNMEEYPQHWNIEETKNAGGGYVAILVEGEK
jgi:hypothetical protein